MTERDYMAEAKAAIELEMAAEVDARISNRAAQMQHANERQQQLAGLRAFHGLPDTATLREMADAEIDHANRRRSYVSNRYAGNATAAQILSPESAPPELRAEFQARQDKLFAEFEALYAREVAARRVSSEQVTDGTRQHYGHNLTVAA